MDDIKLFTDYKAFKGAAESLLDAEQRFGPQNVRVIVTTLLGWLKDQRRFRLIDPLTLNMDCDWCQCLSTWLDSNCPLSKYFELKDGVFDFRKHLDDEEKARIRDYVDQNYRPRMMAL